MPDNETQLWMVNIQWLDNTIHTFARVFNDKIIALEKRIADLERQLDTQQDKTVDQDREPQSTMDFLKGISVDASEVQAEVPEAAKEPAYFREKKREKKWITNGTESKKILIDEDVPDGWVRGRACAFGRTKKILNATVDANPQASIAGLAEHLNNRRIDSRQKKAAA
jgi:hypothetical protein